MSPLSLAGCGAERREGDRGPRSLRLPDRRGRRSASPAAGLSLAPAGILGRGGAHMRVGNFHGRRPEATRKRKRSGFYCESSPRVPWLRNHFCFPLPLSRAQPPQTACKPWVALRARGSAVEIHLQGTWIHGSVCKDFYLNAKQIHPWRLIPRALHTK